MKSGRFVKRTCMCSKLNDFILNTTSSEALVSNMQARVLVSIVL
jgi:hypothetical protein